MKICALSPFRTAKKVEILEFLKGADADLVVLPGYSLGNSPNTPSTGEIQQVIKCNVSVFMEEGIAGKGKSDSDKDNSRLPYLVTKHRIISMPKQKFKQPPAASDLESLNRILPRRTFAFGKRKVTFFLCGEILAFNPDGSVKHSRELPYDILVNPTHFLMGRWNYLGRKLKALSKKTIAIHVANNTSNHARITTDVRIYKNGVRLRKKSQEGNLSWCECKI